MRERIHVDEEFMERRRAGQRIQDGRIAAGLSETELAEQIGTTWQGLRAIERAYVFPTVGQIAALRQSLGPLFVPLTVPSCPDYAGIPVMRAP